MGMSELIQIGALAPIQGTRKTSKVRRKEQHDLAGLSGSLNRSQCIDLNQFTHAQSIPPGTQDVHIFPARVGVCPTIFAA